MSSSDSHSEHIQQYATFRKLFMNEAQRSKAQKWIMDMACSAVNHIDAHVPH